MGRRQTSSGLRGSVGRPVSQPSSTDVVTVAFVGLDGNWSNVVLLELAVAMLTAAKPKIDAIDDGTAHDQLRGFGSLVSWTRSHHVPSCCLRIGISTNRYENSVITAVSDHRGGELGDGQLRTGRVADDLVDRPVEQVQPVRAGADPVEDGVAEQRTRRCAAGA